MDNNTNREDIVNEKLQFWVEVWSDLIKYFTKNHYGLDLANPHLALLTLIDEIEHNELRNKEVRQYLLETIGYYLKQDSVIKQFLSVEFRLILASFNNHASFYLLQSAKSALPFFTSGDYFIKSYEVLQTLLINEKPNTGYEDQIETFASSLIVELLLKGYALKTIQSMPQRILCDVSKSGNNFPTNIDWNDYVDLPTEYRDQYDVKRSVELQNLTLERRLSAFSKFFSKKPCEHVFLFGVEGLKGTTELTLGPVTFYSPVVKSFIKEDANPTIQEGLQKQERFGKSDPESFANAAVRISCIDPEHGELQAAEAANKALDLLRSRYNIECPLKVGRGSYVHLSKGGRYRGSGHSTNESFMYKLHQSLDLHIIADNKENLNDFEQTARYLFSPKELQSPLEQKIADCLHWLRKGHESDRLEDRLLHYWIVMEKMFTFPSSSPPLLKGGDKLEPKLLLIIEFLSSARATDFFYGIGRTLYYYLWPMFVDPLLMFARASKSLCKPLPREVAEKCGFLPSSGGSVLLAEFRMHFDALSEAVDDPLIKRRIFYAKRFYEDGDFAMEEIRRVISRTKNDIVLIYRYRNSIMHNAHYDTNLLLPFVEKAATLAQTAVNMVIHQRANASSATVEQMFASRHFEVQRTLERLEKKLPVDFFQAQTWNLSSKPN